MRDAGFASGARLVADGPGFGCAVVVAFAFDDDFTQFDVGFAGKNGDESADGEF